MPDKNRQKWQRPFKWPPSTWEFTPGLQLTADIITCLIFGALLVTVAGALITWPFLIARTFTAVFSGTADDIRNILLAVAALVGVPFLIWRTLIASKQTEINRESHYTALFTKAVEQLGAEKTVKRRDFKPIFQQDEQTKQPVLEKGKPVPALSPAGEPLGEYENYEVTVTNYEVRLGAIYALERIAQDSQRDSTPIFMTLCAYVQNNSTANIADLKQPPQKRNNSDIEEIFNVLGRHGKLASLFAFENIHLPDFRYADATLSSFLFRNCSVANVICGGPIAEIAFQNSLIGDFVINNTEVEDLSFADCNLEQLRIISSSANHLHSISTNVSATLISVSELAHCDFKIGFGKLNFYRNSFSDCSFREAEQSFMKHRHQFDENVFRDCEFINCDLSFQDFNRSEFYDCRFQNCNLIQVASIPGERNQFVGCFTEEHVVPDPDGTFSETGIRTQWIDWRYRIG